MIITLENFQNIDYAEIKFDKGLNIITGLNGLGKTCLIRALNSLIFNPKRVKKGFKKNTEGYIQNGKDYCRVSCKCEGFPTVTWECNKEGTLYIVDGQKFTKSMGGLSLIDLVPNHPFSIFENECLNISKQHSPALLFDRTSSGIFNLIDSLCEVVDTSTELQNFKNYRAEKVKEKETLSEHLLEVTENKTQLEKIESTVNTEKLKIAFSKYQTMKEKHASLEVLIKLLKRKKQLKEETKEIEKEKISKIIEEIKKLFKLETLVKDINRLNELKGVEQVNIKINNYKQLKELYNLVKERETCKGLLEKNSIEVDKLKASVVGTVCPTCNQIIKEL